VAFVSVGGRRIEVERIPAGIPGRPALVFLHEGLGSLAMWRDFPARVAHACGCDAVVYSRHGYGRSAPLEAPRGVRYLHDEALVALPDVLRAAGVVCPVLVGHSDGGSIALIHAGSGHPVAGLVLLAPHVFVEDVSIASIAAAGRAFDRTDLRARLARYHDDVDSAFYGWADIWLHPDFRAWNIEACLPRIACPVLAIQGEDDEYGTMEQVRRIAAQAPDVDVLALADCRHSPHRDQPEAVIDAITRFLDRLTTPPAMSRP
jgi:pimeloyl-ACP methyl ester carboxylesterase